MHSNCTLPRGDSPNTAQTSSDGDLLLDLIAIGALPNLRRLVACLDEAFVEPVGSARDGHKPRCMALLRCCVEGLGDAQSNVGAESSSGSDCGLRKVHRSLRWIASFGAQAAIPRSTCGLRRHEAVTFVASLPGG